ncbi:MAG: class I SAM-dependent methyltransferase [Minisyncoccota bacterium]
MNHKCLICGGESKFLLKKDGFDEHICPKCGLSFVHPQPEAEWLRDEVYSLESGYQRNKTTDLSIEKENKRYGRMLDYIAERRPEGKLLDVGCSSGQVMYWARKRGLSPSGVEINKRTADMARENGFPVFNGFLADADYPKGDFDLIFLGDVIEHVNNPRKFIEEAKSFLKNDGLLVISTPNVNCFWSKFTLLLYKLFKIPWTSATPPYHLFQFSYENLNILMNEFGFRPEKVFYLPPPSLKYELGSLHLYKRYKQDKNLGNLFFMLFAFGVYTAVYGLNWLKYLLIKKDFQMTVVYSLSK